MHIRDNNLNVLYVASQLPFLLHMVMARGCQKRIIHAIMVIQIKKLAISKIKHGQFEEAFKFAHNSACTEEDILTFLLKISFRDHDFKNTLTYAERLIELHSQSSIGYRWKAENLDDGYDKTKESIRFSTKAIELDPNDAYAYVIRGNTKRWMEPADFEGATKDYNAAINIDEN